MKLDGFGIASWLFQSALVLSLAPAWATGCYEAPGPGAAARDDRNRMDPKITIPNYYLSFADLAAFRRGRAKRDVLEQIGWRAGPLWMARCDGKSVCVILYEVLPDKADDRGGVAFLAVFSAGKFLKFIDWLPRHEPRVPGDDSDRDGLANRQWLCDRRWFRRVLKAPSLTVEDIREKVASFQPPPKHTDYGLTLAWLLFGEKVRRSGSTAEDYQRNAVVREQLNAAKLDIGMTQNEIERILRAKAIHSERVECGRLTTFGSKESLRVPRNVHYRNVLVLFKEGKADLIVTVPGGDWYFENQKGAIAP